MPHRESTLAVESPPPPLGVPFSTQHHHCRRRLRSNGAVRCLSPPLSFVESGAKTVLRVSLSPKSAIPSNVPRPETKGKFLEFLRLFLSVFPFPLVVLGIGLENLRTGLTWATPRCPVTEITVSSSLGGAQSPSLSTNKAAVTTTDEQRFQSIKCSSRITLRGHLRVTSA